MICIDGRFALFVPADVRADGEAVIPYLSLFHKLVQGLEQLLVLDRVHLRVVKLVQVNVIRLEPPQALLARVANEVGLPLLGPLRMALSRGIGVEIVAEFRADYDLVAMLLEGLGKDLLPIAQPIGIAGVKKVHPPIEGLDQKVYPLGLLDLSPPVRADSPDAEAYFGDVEISGAKLTILQLTFLI